MAPINTIEALIQFIVLTNQPFTICNSPSFMALYTLHSSICPIINSDSLHNVIGSRFQGCRIEV